VIGNDRLCADASETFFESGIALAVLKRLEENVK
jgi:hypothetical protein